MDAAPSEPGTETVDPPASAAQSLLIRPIAPDDKQAMIDAFQQLSEESRYRRFLAPHGRLTPAELRYFTEVDHHDHEALVAVEPVTNKGAGVARYVRSTEDPSVAELAIAVIDDWQSQGVGTRLAAALTARAREEGITSFSAVALADNDQVLNLLADLGEVRVVHRELGTVEVTVELPKSGLGQLMRLLRAVARGEIIPFPPRIGPKAAADPQEEPGPPEPQPRERPDTGDAA